MIRKKGFKILLVLFIGLFIAGIFSVSYHYFFSKVIFYKPCRIEVEGIDKSEFLKISCIGFSPLGKKQILAKDSLFYSFSSPYYSHYKEITLTMPAYVYDKIAEVVLYYGGDHWNIEGETIRKKQLITDLTKTDKQLNLSECVKTNNSLFFVYLSSLTWGGAARMFYVCLLLVLFSITSLLLYRFRRKTFHKIVSKVNLVLFQTIPSVIHSWSYRFLLSLLLVVLFSVIYFNKSNFTGAKFVMNDWTYHSSGVNFAKGYGISRLGGIESFEAYKFSDYGNNLEYNYRMFTRFPGLYFYHSPPGYGLFLGIIYCLGGINPYLVKYIQLILLIIIASFLPVLGYRPWGVAGYLCGLVASFFFMNEYFRLANEIQPQALLFFMCFIMLILYEFYLQKKSLLLLILFGLSVSFAVLVKISLIMFPVMIVLHFVYTFVRERKSLQIYQLLVFFITFLIPVLSWSLYANLHTNSKFYSSNNVEKLKFELFDGPLSAKDTAFLHPIIRKDSSLNDLNAYINDGGVYEKLGTYNRITIDLFGSTFFDTTTIFIAASSQKEGLLLAHNEFINKGDFSLEWYKNKNSFYHNDNLGNKPPWMRVLNFYLHFPQKIISLPLQKLYKGFGNYCFLNVLLLAFIVITFFNLSEAFGKSKWYWKALLFGFTNVLLMSPFFYPWSRGVYYIILGLFLTSGLLNVVLKNKAYGIKLPVSFAVIIISQLLLTVIASGNHRFTEIIDFIFMLSGIYAIFYINQKILLPVSAIKEFINRKLSAG